MMFFKPLMVSNKPVITTGSMYYSNVSRAMNTIWIKKRIIEEFPELKSKDPTYYRLEFYKSFQQLQEKIDQLKESKEAIPLLLYFYK